MRLFVFCSLLLGAAAQFCPTGWILFENTCYQYHSNSTISGFYETLVQRCKDVDAVMAAAETKTEFTFLDGLSKKEIEQISNLVTNPKRLGHLFMLGARRIGKSRNWLKEDGLPYNPKNWCPGWGNDNNKGQQNYACIRTTKFPQSCIDDQNLAGVFGYRFACKKPSYPQATFEYLNGKCTPPKIAREVKDFVKGQYQKFFV